MEELVPFTPEVIPERINPDWTTPLYAMSLFKSVCIDAKNDPTKTDKKITAKKKGSKSSRIKRTDTIHILAITINEAAFTIEAI